MSVCIFKGGTNFFSQWPLISFCTYSSSRPHVSPTKSVLWVISSKRKGEFCTQSEPFFFVESLISGCHVEEPSDYLASSTSFLLPAETSPAFRISLAKWWKLLVTFENMALQHCLCVRMTRKAARGGLALGSWRKEVHGSCNALMWLEVLPQLGLPRKAKEI